MFVSIGEASALIGVAVSTLRRWEKEARFYPTFRTKGNHRRYDMNDIRVSFLSQSSIEKPRHSNRKKAA
jgi:DNA-binding transcriptional MerR regulator